MLSISRDGPSVFMDWIEEMKVIKFPLVGDSNLASFDVGISQRLGISLPAGYAIPSIIVIDKKGALRYIGSNLPAPGNSADEVLRVVTALNSVVDPGKGEKITPANGRLHLSSGTRREKWLNTMQPTNLSQREEHLTSDGGIRNPRNRKS